MDYQAIINDTNHKNSFMLHNGHSPDHNGA